MPTQYEVQVTSEDRTTTTTYTVTISLAVGSCPVCLNGGTCVDGSTCTCVARGGFSGINCGTTVPSPMVNSCAASDTGNQAGIGIGDTLTLGFSSPTDLAGIDPQNFTMRELAELVSFEPTVATFMSADWASSTSLVLTVECSAEVNALGDPLTDQVALAKVVATLQADQAFPISDSSGLALPVVGSVPISGTFGGEPAGRCCCCFLNSLWFRSASLTPSITSVTVTNDGAGLLFAVTPPLPVSGRGPCEDAIPSALLATMGAGASCRYVVACAPESTHQRTRCTGGKAQPPFLASSESRLRRWLARLSQAACQSFLPSIRCQSRSTLRGQK